MCLKKKQFWLHKYSTTLGRVSLVSTLRFTQTLPFTWTKGKQLENGFVSGNFRCRLRSIFLKILTYKLPVSFFSLCRRTTEDRDSEQPQRKTGGPASRNRINRSCGLMPWISIKQGFLCVSKLCAC